MDGWEICRIFDEKQKPKKYIYIKVESKVNVMSSKVTKNKQSPGFGRENKHEKEKKKK